MNATEAPKIDSSIGDSRAQNRPRLGFLGLGWIGLHRLASVHAADVAQIAAYCDPAADEKKLAEQFPTASRVKNLAALLASDLDGIYIATPSALHAAQTIEALESGVAVFCQKPLGREVREVREMVAIARRKNRLLDVDLSYRHIAGLVKIRELVQASELGKIFAVDLVFHNSYGPGKPWFYDRTLAGGGCVLDLGIHLVDAALWALETSATNVRSRLFAGGQPLLLAPEAVEDFALAEIDLADGAIASLACSWGLSMGKNAAIELRFFGTKGGAALVNVGGSFTDFRASLFRGTSQEVLAEPPDDWGGRAAIAFARRLATSADFNPEIERQIEVATVLDAIYGRESAEPFLDE